MVHLRAEGQGKLYIQELVNRFFDDAEVRIRGHGVSLQVQKEYKTKLTVFAFRFHNKR